MRIPVLLFLLTCASSSRSFAQENLDSFVLTAEQQTTIITFANNIKSDIHSSQCKAIPCEVLVTNFLVAGSGKTCTACLALSDAVAKIISDNPPSPDVVSRFRLHSFLEQERIPSELLNQKEALRWLAKQFHATHMLIGVVERKNELVELKVQLQRFEGTGGSTIKTKKMSILLPASNLAGGLEPRESFGFFTQRTTTQYDEPLYSYSKASVGMTSPRCTYMPSPGYNDAAREAKISGAVLLELVVTAQGTIGELRIVQGLPFGLNEASLETAKTWQCEPAKQDGKPVPTIVRFEVNFKLY